MNRRGHIWAFLLGVSFAVNWLWEMAQMFAYAPMPGHSWPTVMLYCTAASVGDAALTLFIYRVLVLATRRSVSRDGWVSYAGAALLGAGVAAVIEWAAVGMGWWSYTSKMPLVPLIGVGVLPFLQLTLLTPLSIWLARRLSRTPEAAGSGRRSSRLL